MLTSTPANDDKGVMFKFQRRETTELDGNGSALADLLRSAPTTSNLKESFLTCVGSANHWLVYSPLLTTKEPTDGRAGGC